MKPAMSPVRFMGAMAAWVLSKAIRTKQIRRSSVLNEKVPDWDSCDTIYLGYPIWWGDTAWLIDNFVKDSDFSGKTIYPFCTS